MRARAYTGAMSKIMRVFSALAVCLTATAAAQTGAAGGEWRTWWPATGSSA